jgi:NADPH-dependent 2,4-dienoyl-CoA reductase/sulfur reductase-like enzyme
VGTGYVAVAGPLLAPTRTAPAEVTVLSPLHRRERAAPRGARRPAAPEHPVLVGAGVAGLLTVSVLRRRHGRDRRDEPVTLGISF